MELGLLRIRQRRLQRLRHHLAQRESRQLIILVNVRH